MLGQVHPITFSCYHTVEEYTSVASGYVVTGSDYKLFSYNLVYHFKDLFDDAMVVALLSLMIPDLTLTEYSELAYTAGNML